MNGRAGALLALLAVLVLGAAAGVAGDRAWMASRDSNVASTETLITAMREHVGIDTLQERQVRAVLARHQRAVDSAWGQVRPNVHAAINAAQMDIAILLRGDQRERYMKWIQSVHRGVPPMNR
jgi:hypothetical protein